eukprot:SAG11_NODE_20004_length_454_cov_1.645070_1_plen_65_part_10
MPPTRCSPADTKKIPDGVKVPTKETAGAGRQELHRKHSADADHSAIAKLTQARKRVDAGLAVASA